MNGAFACDEAHCMIAEESKHMQIENVKFEQSPTIESCFPSSTKIFKTFEHANGPLEVPFRRIELTGGAGYFDVQDTSGVQVELHTPCLGHTHPPDLRCSLHST
jgi:hypothetical protein